MIAQAAVSHLGAALLPRFLIEQELAAGSLVELSDLVLTSTDAYYLVKRPEARAQSPLVKAFRDWLVAECHSPETRPQGLLSARGKRFFTQRRHRAQRRLGKQVALHEPDATVGHKIALTQRFNALGNHGDPISSHSRARLRTMAWRGRLVSTWRTRSMSILMMSG